MMNDRLRLTDTLRQLRRDLVVTGVFSLAVAALYAALGAGATAATKYARIRQWELLDQSELLAIGVPVFVVAWIGWSLRRRMLQSAAAALLMSGGLGVVAALANRFVLAEGDGASCSCTSLVDGIRIVLTLAARAFAGDIHPDAYLHLGAELGDPVSLLWFSIAGVVVAMAGALVIQRSFRRVRGAAR
jgi:hypothetical protein